MSEFKPIETQEEFNAALKSRLEQAERSFLEKYDSDKLVEQLKEKTALLEDATKKLADVSSQLEESKNKVAESDSTVADLKAQVHRYETASVKTRIAHEIGIPIELAERLTGEDEEAIREDAKVLASVVGSVKPSTTPQFNPEPEPPKDEKSAAWQKLANELSKGEF